MSKRPKHLKSQNTVLKINGKDILGLDSLKNSLEKHYFSNVSIRNSFVCCEENNLVIDLYCDLGLHEVLFHIQQGTWGIEKPTIVNKGLTLLSKHMQGLRELNNTFIDVEELSLILNDCSIVVKKLEPESVENELESILNALGDNYVYLTKNLCEIPNEIFIPVYEEVSASDHITSLVGPTRIIEKDYYSYWGLYFEKAPEAVIYDFKQKRIISGDLNLLNL